MIDTLTKHADNLKTILELEGEEGQFEYLIDIGKKKGSLEPQEKIDKNKMSGCLAQVWIKFDTKNGKNYFDGDSDALIVKGLVKIIAEALSGLTNDEIKELKHDIVNKYEKRSQYFCVNPGPLSKVGACCRPLGA